MSAKILWIDDKRIEGHTFIPFVRESGYTIEVATTGTQALRLLSEFNPNLVILNAAYLRTSPHYFCKLLRIRNENLPIILISTGGSKDKKFRFENEISIPFAFHDLKLKISTLTPEHGSILWINTHKSKPHISQLRKLGYKVETVPSGKVGLEQLRDNKPNLVVLNAIDMITNGIQIYNDLKELNLDLSVLIITNPEHGEEQRNKKFEPNEELILPFTFRKLANRIKTYIPTEGRKIIKLGQIQLDLEHNQLKCQKRKVKITPRLANLLRVFMQHPGELLERGWLFSEVWNTQYTEDTRTLDVHISWLRRALEEDPRNPRILKTIRGVGYRLDV